MIKKQNWKIAPPKVRSRTEHATVSAHALGAMLTLACALLAGKSASAQAVDVSSPDRHIAVHVWVPEGRLMYQVMVNNQLAVLPSAMGLTVDGQDLGENPRIGAVTRGRGNETYPVLGGHRVAVNRYEEATVPLTTGVAKTPWQLQVRVFNDGVAYRYRVAGAGEHRITGESSQWRLPAESVLWYQSYTREYERPYQEQQVGRMTAGDHIGAPATAKLPNGLGYAMMTEANLVNYSDMGLEVSPEGSFNARFFNDDKGWTTQGDITSPWRVTLLARDLTALVNSDILQNLCPPPAPELAQATWIKPGRAVWHWMVTGPPRQADQRQWVDWTQQLGLEYYLIDDGWRRWNAPGKDQWAVMKDVVDYATTKGVKIWAWVNSEEILDAPSRAAYFQKAKDVGLVGLKIDFPQGANVRWVNWYDETLRDLTNYHLMVDFHGAIKPTGRERTYPHELTREAIFGRESGKLPALHDTSLPFVRYAQGHADFTPTDFRLDRLNGSSWAHELAQAVVYTSPFLCYGGSPANYLQNPAVDVLKSIPSTWDETIVLPNSEIGRTAAYARRKGNTWFIGVVNGGIARPFPISLGFLGKGSYRIDQLADSAERNDAWVRTQRNVTRKDSFSVDVRDNGGFVARITPLTQ